MNSKFKTLAAFWAAWMSVAASQPTACTEDTQCPVGFYCEERARYCSECLSCSELRREEPVPADSCVKSVLQCGPCYKGLEDRLLDGGCVEPSSRSSGGPPTYMWVFIGSVIALVVLIGLLIFVFLKKDKLMHILKIRATAVSPRNANTGVTPSAPESMPPSYDDVCLTERPHSPYSDVTQPSRWTQDDSERPLFVKRAGDPDYPRSQFEAASNEEARPFSNPNYIRGPVTTTTTDEPEPVTPFEPHDEETMESHWTPNEPSNNTSLNTFSNAIGYLVSEEAAGPETATGTVRVRRASGDSDGPPSKALCVRQESNDGAEPAGGAAGAAGAPQAVTNVYVINNFR